MTIHPDHTRHLHRIGTVAGYPVHVARLDSADHPSLPRSSVALNGTTSWVRIGAAPWTRADRLQRVYDWLDPVGSLWTLADLTDILIQMGLPEIEDGDWPEACGRGACLYPTQHPDHWTEHLPTAQRHAADRYARLIRECR